MRATTTRSLIAGAKWIVLGLAILVVVFIVLYARDQPRIDVDSRGLGASALGRIVAKDWMLDEGALGKKVQAGVSSTGCWGRACMEAFGFDACDQAGNALVCRYRGTMDVANSRLANGPRHQVMTVLIEASVTPSGRADITVGRSGWNGPGETLRVPAAVALRDNRHAAQRFRITKPGIYAVQLLYDLPESVPRSEVFDFARRSGLGAPFEVRLRVMDVTTGRIAQLHSQTHAHPKLTAFTAATLEAELFRAELQPGDYLVDADIPEGAPPVHRIPLRIGVAPAYVGK